MAANIILIIHFAIAIFIGSNLALIAIGGILKWPWVKIRLFRQIHAGLMMFVLIESILGVACPLTVLESHLRSSEPQGSFLGYWLNRLLYWDLPNIFFLILYAACLAWTIILWRAVPPKKASNRQEDY